MVEGLAERYNWMDYQSDLENTETLRVNPSAIVESTTMMIPTLSKIEITRKRIHSKVMDFEEEILETSKRLRIESDIELVEARTKKLKEKVQGLDFEVQVYNFSEIHERSNDRL